MHTNLIPLKGALLYPFLINLRTLVTANAGEWGISDAVVASLVNATDPFIRAWEVFITPNSGKIDRGNMNAALKTVRPFAASFARTYLLYNPAISAALMIQMGFGGKDKPLQGWHTAPIVWVEHAVRQVLIRFKGREPAHQGKAIGAQHMEARYKFSALKPENVEDYTAMEKATKSPLVITCSEEQRGACMWYWVRWVTNANKNGDWSDMFPVYVT
ncbi:hypothetical protein FACS1894147_04520 [Spirochaetia bacterium]|nr:hypothetical protein FACS1894147_04520 [Spirochaetia bacterium]